MKNLFEDVPTTQTEERFTELLTRPGVTVERIVSTGQRSPDGFWYDQPRAEWVVVLAGAARVEFEDHGVDLTPGDSVDIPAHTKHRVAWTSPGEPTVWLAVHYGGGEA